MAPADGTKLVTAQLPEKFREVATEMPGEVRGELLGGSGTFTQLGAEDAKKAE